MKRLPFTGRTLDGAGERDDPRGTRGVLPGGAPP